MNPCPIVEPQKKCRLHRSPTFIVSAGPPPSPSPVYLGLSASLPGWCLWPSDRPPGRAGSRLPLSHGDSQAGSFCTLKIFQYNETKYYKFIIISPPEFPPIISVSKGKGRSYWWSVSAIRLQLDSILQETGRRRCHRRSVIRFEIWLSISGINYQVDDI